MGSGWGEGMMAVTYVRAYIHNVCMCAHALTTVYVLVCAGVYNYVCTCMRMPLIVCITVHVHILTYVHIYIQYVCVCLYVCTCAGA